MRALLSCSRQLQRYHPVKYSKLGLYREVNIRDERKPVAKKALGLQDPGIYFNPKNMPITIRAAQEQDSAIVPAIMLQAMEAVIFHFIQQQDRLEAIDFLTRLFRQPGNLYRYEHTFVAVDENETILGTLTGYDGDKFTGLRQPVLDLVKARYNNAFVPEPETQGNEFYLDSIAVTPAARGKGVGTLLLQHALNHARTLQFKQVGLLVDLHNPDAQKLYQRLGFRVGASVRFAGGQYHHMYAPLD